MNKTSKTFIVIPLYNEEKRISSVLTDVSKFKLPVVVVNDGSKDSSAEKVRQKNLMNVTLLSHKINLGKGAAMKTGADWAISRGATGLIFMDSDGQHKASDLPGFVEILEKGGCDVIFGSRNYSYGVPLIRFLGNKFASVFIAFLFGIYISDVICGFRAMTVPAYKKIRWESGGYGVETEVVAMTARKKLKYCEVPVQTVYHDKTKGVTLLDAIGIFWDVIQWKLRS